MNLVLRNISSARLAVLTIGSPLVLKEVLAITAICPVASSIFVRSLYSHGYKLFVTV